MKDFALKGFLCLSMCVGGGLIAQTVNASYQRPAFLDSYSLGMGGATAGIVDNAASLFGNPASIDFKAKAYDFFVGGQWSALGGVGVGVADTYSSPVSGTLSFHYFVKNGETNFDPLSSSIRVSLGFGYHIKDIFRFALAGNLYRGQAFGSTNVFYSFTPGVLLDLGFLKLGAYAPDIVSIVETELPSQVILGVSKNLSSSFLLSAQGGYVFGKKFFPDTAIVLRAGAKYRFPKLFSVSLGYGGEYSQSDNNRVTHTASLGLELKIDNHSVIITESYNFIRQENTLSLGYRYTPTDEPPEPEESVTNF